MGGTQSQASLEHREPLLSEDKSSDEQKPTDLGTLIFQLNSFLAVLWPVLLTMLLASVVAANVQDSATQTNMRSYLYYKDIDGSMDSDAAKTMEALINALVIIAFIATITFVVVFLYKFNCMKGLVGYLMFSSSILLGFVGSVLVKAIFVDKLQIPCDMYSMTFIMYNFAIVGTISIFYQKGIPKFVEKGYLIATSVIMAWQLCQLPEWSAWTILCMLAFWDLFAVLTPCGPLRCLVNLISKEGRPMPGLLYEAEVRSKHLSLPEELIKPPHESKNIELPTISSNAEEQKNFFEHQICSFYQDFNPQNMHQSEKLASIYWERQSELWAALFEKYQVRHTLRDRIYPSVAAVRQNTESASGAGCSTIKLGLGDFIFYSVLVGRASLHSFGAFAACLLCVTVGLGITMYLLAKFNALPALPISILLAVVMFAGCQSTIMPLVNASGVILVMF